MVRTLISIAVTLLLITGVSVYEINHVRETFAIFHEALETLYSKTENETASHEDGKVVRKVWEREKKDLHIWIPHTVIENIDYQLNEMLGYLYEYDFQDALPKIEILLEISEFIPKTYSLSFENIF
ncbi:MAG: DUF4363 family protein [Clostridia bacterium]|nr:DUF4363 family protein [Clostridia bacterium]